MTDPAIITREVDARFWSTGYKPGLKLDPKDPTDKTMIPVWLDIQAKVKAEDAAGHLVLTYNHPVVEQNLADAHIASQAAATHLDAAVTAPDPAIAQQHVAAAAHHVDVAAQKTAAAASVQPPTASPEIAQAASQDAAQQPKHLHKQGHKHVAQAQAEAAGAQVAQTQAVASMQPHASRPHPRSILEREVDARFWGLGYRPGQKLDPHNPTDAKMIPLWRDIFAKVKAEDDAGNLVLTYNNPIVAQKLADAHVADQAAVMHTDAAAAAPDPQDVQQNVAAATTALQISAQRAHEAAQLQPPTVSLPLAHAQAQAAKQSPPPPGASARDHIAHGQAQAAGNRAAKVHHHHGRRQRPVRSTAPPGKVQDYRAQAAQRAHEAGAQWVLVIQHPDGTPDQQTFGSRAELDAAYAKISEQHDQYKYVAAFDLTTDPNAPVHDSVGIPAAEHVEEPAPAPGGAPSEGGPAAPAEAPSEGWSTGKKIAVAVAAIAAAGGLVYMATRKSSPPSPPARSRAPREFAATPVQARLMGPR